MRITTEKEFYQLQAIISLSTACRMLRELYEDVQNSIPGEMQDLFRQLVQILDDLRNPIFDYVENITIIPDDEEENRNET